MKNLTMKNLSIMKKVFILILVGGFLFSCSKTNDDYLEESISKTDNDYLEESIKMNKRLAKSVETIKSPYTMSFDGNSSLSERDIAWNSAHPIVDPQSNIQIAPATVDYTHHGIFEVKTGTVGHAASGSHVFITVEYFVFEATDGDFTTKTRRFELTPTGNVFTPGQWSRFAIPVTMTDFHPHDEVGVGLKSIKLELEGNDGWYYTDFNIIYHAGKTISTHSLHYNYNKVGTTAYNESGLSQWLDGDEPAFPNHKTYQINNQLFFTIGINRMYFREHHGAPI